MRLALTVAMLLSTFCLAHAADDIFDAARRGDLAAVKAALDAGAPVDAKWRYDQTALYIAAFRGHAPVVQLLLERGASPDARDTFYKMSALDAAAGKNAEILGLLVAKGAKGGETLLPDAAASGRKIVVETLLANGKWSQNVLDETLL
ncbi:MAG: ankyrin repeat domain-containing protein, partial [Bryobacteraceae bacterium]|nr:ankyrin repeat domain-containing protein [Bryobacteraceae bacterium]